MIISYGQLQSTGLYIFGRLWGALYVDMEKRYFGGSLDPAASSLGPFLLLKLPGPEASTFVPTFGAATMFGMATRSPGSPPTWFLPSLGSTFATLGVLHTDRETRSSKISASLIVEGVIYCAEQSGKLTSLRSGFAGDRNGQGVDVESAEGEGDKSGFGEHDYKECRGEEQIITAPGLKFWGRREELG